MKMKFLVLGVALLAIFISVEGASSSGTIMDPPCSFDPKAACDRCNFTRGYVAYVANACDCREYYSCEKVRGVIVPHKQSCPCGLCFSNDNWVCSIPNGEQCPTQAPVTEAITVVNDVCYRAGQYSSAGPYKQKFKRAYKPGTSPLQVDTTRYIWIVDGLEVSMQCPPGTYFNFSSQYCQCVACPSPLPSGLECSVEDVNVFCLDFDDSSKMKGIWCDVSKNITYVPGHTGQGALFDGFSSNIECPYFTNNEFSEFTWSCWIKRDSSNPAGGQGVIYNGGNPDRCPGSIKIVSDGSSVSGGIQTAPNNTLYNILGSGSAPIGSFDHVALRYNGTSLDLFVNGVKDSIPASGSTRRNDCPLLIGESFSSSGVPQFFKGIIDDCCFYRRALSDAKIASLFSPGSFP